MINRVWVEYWLWEDYCNGFYNTNCSNELALIQESVSYMKDYDLFKEGMERAVFNWHNSMLNNLTNSSMNKIAYIGQCANCFDNKIPSFVTKKAWKLLTEQEMKINNNSALNVFESWKKIYYPKLMSTSLNGSKGVTEAEYQTRLNLL